MTAWPLMRIDELRLGDRIEWKEFHEGVLVVTHLATAMEGFVEVGCDRWATDIWLPADELVSVDPDRPAPDPYGDG